MLLNLSIPLQVVKGLGECANTYQALCVYDLRILQIARCSQPAEII
jgi:hypothetical protein